MYLLVSNNGLLPDMGGGGGVMEDRGLAWCGRNPGSLALCFISDNNIKTERNLTTDWCYSIFELITDPIKVSLITSDPMLGIIQVPLRDP